MHRHQIGITSSAALAAALALGAAACGDEVPEMKDVGFPDAGMLPDLGTPDLGMTDGGPMGPCNPVDGSGCPSGEYCVLNLNTDEGVCRTLPAMNAFGEQCDSAMQDCAPGLVCVAIEQGQPAICAQACDNLGSTCTGLPDTSSTYTCGNSNAEANYGICFASGGPSCDPLDALGCGANMTCGLVSADFDTACVDAGNGQVGGSCMPGTNECAPGQGICINLGGTPSCFETCGPQKSCTSMNAACQTLQTQGGATSPFGVCIEQEPTDTCDPVNPMCEANENCSLVGGINDFGCQPAGTAQIGGACSPQNNCGPDQGVCINLGQGGQCYQTCALMGGTCPNGQTCGGLMTQDGMMSTWGICN